MLYTVASCERLRLWTDGPGPGEQVSGPWPAPPSRRGSSIATR
jgi:hypothetical protein